MTHKEFIEKFCPNYKELNAQLQRLVDEYCQQEPLSERELELNETIPTLNEIMFDNALQNFADKICKKQIEIIIGESWNYLKYEHDLVFDIRCTPRPKIEDL